VIVIGDGSAVVTLDKVHVAAALVGRRVVRVDRERFRKLGDGLVILTLIEELISALDVLKGFRIDFPLLEIIAPEPADSGQIPGLDQNRCCQRRKSHQQE